MKAFGVYPISTIRKHKTNSIIELKKGLPFCLKIIDLSLRKMLIINYLKNKANNGNTWINLLFIKRFKGEKVVILVRKSGQAGKNLKNIFATVEIRFQSNTAIYRVAHQSNRLVLIPDIPNCQAAYPMKGGPFDLRLDPQNCLF